MIVTCERCATQFQLDDTRIPASGVRVRCSRCKHAFEIGLPEPGVPPDSGPGPEDEESDWEFNEDLPGPDPEASAAAIGVEKAANVVDELLGSAELSGPALPPPSPPDDEFSVAPPLSGLDLAEEAPRETASPPVAEEAPPAAGPASGAEAPSAPEAAPDPAPEVAPDPASEAAPDLALEAEPDLAPEAAPDPRPQTPPQAAPSEAGSPLDALVAAEDGGDSGLDLDSAAEPAAGEQGSADLVGDELQSPENWDLLAGEAESEGADFGVSSSHSAPAFEIDTNELIDDQPQWQAWLSQAGNVAGWAVVIALFVFGLQAGLRPPPASAPPAIVVSEGLEVADVSGSWIDHLEAGPVYVVRGRLHNTRRQAVATPQLAVELLDDAGETVGGPAPLLPQRRPEALRESSLGELERRRPGTYPALLPGEKRAFEAVLGPLPNTASRLEVVRVEEPAPIETATLGDAPAADPAPVAPSSQPAVLEPSAPEDPQAGPPAAPAP